LQCHGGFKETDPEYQLLDIAIRRKMQSSHWVDIMATVFNNDASIHDLMDRVVSADEVLFRLEGRWTRSRTLPPTDGQSS
jgi:hypothetical protein